MSYYSRLQKAYNDALHLPLNTHSKYVLFSDCHRGIGNANDNFQKNRTLFLAALQYYCRAGFTYIEIGDGDELWENRDMDSILSAHQDVFDLLATFHRENRLYMLYGNHDIVKKKHPDYYSGILLERSPGSTGKPLFLTHGHQADFLNSALWPLARFLVRYFWKPIEHFGILDLSSPAKNHVKKQKVEKKLHNFAHSNNLILVAGHTHRPVLVEEDLCYCNCGCCVHSYSITCLEIEQSLISLVKWSLSVRADMSIFVSRELLSGPFTL